MGYEHGFGQGYAGGPLGRESRVGAGGTGVALARGVGVHGTTVSSLAAAAAVGKPLRPAHLGTGQRIVLAHARAQMFELLGADAFTVYFDPFLDQQRAYVFGVNACGVQDDGIVNAAAFGGLGGIQLATQAVEE